MSATQNDSSTHEPSTREPSRIRGSEDFNICALDHAAIDALLFLVSDERPGFARDLVEIFWRNFPNSLRDMRRACQAGDGLALSKVAHKTQAAAAAIGALGLAQALRKIQDAALIDSDLSSLAMLNFASDLDAIEADAPQVYDHLRVHFEPAQQT
jgi:HPt (histidine-containing phosphotransfer) domain-containing protein